MVWNHNLCTRGELFGLLSTVPPCDCLCIQIVKLTTASISVNLSQKNREMTT
jgi:hypothetical protein